MSDTLVLLEFGNYLVLFFFRMSEMNVSFKIKLRKTFVSAVLKAQRYSSTTIRSIFIYKCVFLRGLNCDCASVKPEMLENLQLNIDPSARLRVRLLVTVFELLSASVEMDDARLHNFSVTVAYRSNKNGT